MERTGRFRGAAIDRDRMVFEGIGRSLAGHDQDGVRRTPYSHPGLPAGRVRASAPGRCDRLVVSDLSEEVVGRKVLGNSLAKFRDRGPPRK